MQIPLFIDSYSWTQILGLVGGGLIVFGLMGLLISTRKEKTCKAFFKLQPVLRISRSATVYSHGQEVVTFTIQNVGASPAYDIRATIHGKQGKESGPIIPLVRPGDHGHCIWIRPAPDSPLIHRKSPNVRLTLDFQDFWGHSYDLRFPVLQQVFDHNRFTLHLKQDAKGYLMRPWVSWFRMQKILANIRANGYCWNTVPGLSDDYRMAAWR